MVTDGSTIQDSGRKRNTFPLYLFMLSPQFLEGRDLSPKEDQILTFSFSYIKLVMFKITVTQGRV